VGSRAGGFTGAMKVANLAYAYEVPVTMMNCAANFMAHLGAALPNHIMMEVLDNGRDACFTHTHDIEDGWIVLSDRPGLGFEFDREKLTAHALKEPHDLAASGRRQGAGLYVAGFDEPKRRPTV
jgi:L-alanine-DL-glutamate epimerase-like enolase superfamily enzyme